MMLLKDMDAITASAIGTFILGGEIPETLDRAKAVLVKRMLTAEARAREMESRYNRITTDYGRCIDDLAAANGRVEKAEREAKAAAQSELQANYKAMERALNAVLGTLLELSPCAHEECKQGQTATLEWALRMVEVALDALPVEEKP
jgi:hypothetical protein